MADQSFSIVTGVTSDEANQLLNRLSADNLHPCFVKSVVEFGAIRHDNRKLATA